VFITLLQVQGAARTAPVLFRFSAVIVCRLSYRESRLSLPHLPHYHDLHIRGTTNAQLSNLIFQAALHRDHQNGIAVAMWHAKAHTLSAALSASQRHQRQARFLLSPIMSLAAQHPLEERVNL